MEQQSELVRQQLPIGETIRFGDEYKSPHTGNIVTAQERQIGTMVSASLVWFRRVKKETSRPKPD